MKRFITGTASAAALLLLAMPAQAQDMPRPAESETAAIAGTVVDLSCKYTYNLPGDEHRRR